MAPRRHPVAQHFENTAILLPDGTVLVTAEYNGGQVVTAAERYNPTSDTWRMAATPPEVGIGYTTTLLPNGRVLAIGGNTERYGTPVATTATALYAPETDTWTAGTPMHYPRMGQRATLLADGTVLVTGGWSGDGSTAPTERYYPATNTWNLVGVGTVVPAGHAATLLTDGRVLLTGGGDGTNPIAATTIYDPMANTWTAAAPMREPRTGHTATRLPDGTVLVVGGGWPGDVVNSVIVERYDPASDTWRSVAPLPRARRDHATTLLTDGTLLVTGGFVEGGFTSAVERYDPQRDRWLPTFGARTQGTGSNVTLLPDGTVLTVNGRVAERFDRTRPVPQFADVPADAPSYEAVIQLAARTIIRGYGDGNFGPNDRVLRAQIAAIIVRGMAWDTADATNPFPDQGLVDDELWRSVGILANRQAAPGVPRWHL